MATRQPDPRMQVLQRWLRPGRGSDPSWRRRVGAVGLGLLVLFTIWGFGRAWHGGFAPIEFVVGLAAGAVATAVTWRRRGSR